MAVLLLSSLLWWSGITLAAPMTAGHARKLAQAWVAANPKPMGAQLGGAIESVETFSDANSQPIYHVVYLQPAGFVIVPADDEIEPVICFAQTGSFDPSPDNPLGALVSRDLPGRVNAARAIQKMVRSGKALQSFTQQEMDIRHSGEKAFDKWSKLLNAADSCSVLATSLGGISDVRVSPLLQSKWNQTTICSNTTCYNYYTPNNYPCGCVATAMAQYMRFWRYPTTGVGTGCFTVYVNGAARTKCLRGGDGSGGAYSWTDMTLVPDCSTTLIQRRAIGALTYDAGVAVNMRYASSGSGAYISDATAAMVDTFGYSNAIEGGDEITNIGDGLNGMINPNLDWGNPVILGISNSSDGSGHAIVADGYGYNSSTLYHHLNMGWDGEEDIWYNLPNIDSSPSFNIVDSTIYNIYMSGSGEIISGRVTAADTDTPISGATVTATESGGTTYSAVTNSNGIYAIAKIPSSSTYTVSVTQPGYSFTSILASTGLSQDNQPTSGNCWGIDFTGTQFPAVTTRTLTVISTVGGTVTQPGLGTFTCPDGNVVNLVASADVGYHFVNWTGTAVDAGKIADSTSAATTVLMNADYTVIANFIANPVNYILTVNSSGVSGVSINSSTGHGGTTNYTKTVTSGTTVTLTAPSTASGQTFTGWTGDVPSSSQTISFSMNGTKTVTANYVTPSYTLTVNSSGAGASSVSIASSTGHDGITPYNKTVLAGTSVNLQAPQYVGSGASRMSFTGWSGSLTDGNQSITFSMNEPKTVTANYASDPQISTKFGSFGTQTNVKRTLKDCNNNDVTFSLSGGGYGEIDPCDCHFGQIELYDTTDKSVLTIKTKSKIETSIGDINVNGPLKAISAANIELNGSITIGSSLNSNAAVTIVFDQTSNLVINSQMPIKSISATEWRGGSIDAPSIGSITTTGDKKRVIPGDLDVNVTSGTIQSIKAAGTLSGNWTCNSVKGISATDIVETNLTLNQPPDAKILALGSLIAKDDIDSSQILAQGNIGTVTAGAMKNSVCFAGVNSAYLVDVNADGVLDLPVADSNTFSKKATIKSIAIKGIKTEPLPYYINSNIAAANILSVSIAYPKSDNGGVPFGLTADNIKKQTIKKPDLEAIGDFEIRLY
ncbi:MAG: C10 family peptidase [Sedimentisphaerales bacterium]